MTGKHYLGINGVGRIGKLTLWHHILRGYFDGFVVNFGRPVGSSLEDAVQSLCSDSTYGSIEKFLFGVNASRDVSIVDTENNMISMFGKPVKLLLEARNPKDIAWRRERVQLVIDTTGVFADPTVSSDVPGGSIRGHLDAGAKVVINSAPFKIKDKSRPEPEDAIMLIYGINHTEYQPGVHRVLSAASCTTTGLAHMVKPLLDIEETSRIMTASMSTIHASTNSQSVLDNVPKSRATDLRKNRSILNNIILSTTGAANALEKVLPEIRRVGFMADSVRIPTSTVSLINLNVTFHTSLNDKFEPIINKNFLNDIYRNAAQNAHKGQIIFSEKQNVSTDLIGTPAAIIIEGNDTHTRTAFIDIPCDIAAGQGVKIDAPIRLPVTHAKIFGWYDNEYGSYTCALGDLAEYIDKKMA